MTVTYSSPKIAKEVQKHFGNKTQSVKVEMKHKKIIGQFIKKVESAERSSAKSTLVFK